MRAMSLSNTFHRTLRTVVWLGALLLLLLSHGTWASSAKEADEARKILVVYTTEDGTLSESVRNLDLLLGHFTRNVVFKSDEAVESDDLRDISHLVYYGAVPKSLPQQAVQLMGAYRGPVLAVGDNVGQLGERFSFVSAEQKVEIHKVSKQDSSSYDLLEQTYPIAQIALRQGEAILRGWKGDQAFPLLAVDRNSFYFSAVNLDVPFLYYLGEGLYPFFREQPAAGRPAYIRLEDIHPQSDPELLKAAGEVLEEKGIPYMIALIPVYTNPVTHKQQRLKDMPKLVEVLRELQKRGASIVLHGYTHQYRQSETGEGFEFWDVENNAPIMDEPDREVTVRHRHDFPSKEAYESYVEKNRQFNESYTRHRLESGIKELTELGLYPLGFEAPHYTMSQEGYRVAAEYFQYVLGQVQLGDRDWQRMNTAPYVTAPAFLHGMTLLPETIGYYDAVSSSTAADTARKVRQMQFVSGGVIGMFYHPYLGADRLKEFLAAVESVPGLEWIDLKRLEHKPSERFQAVDRTNTPLVLTTATRQLPELGDMGVSQKILWGIAAVVALAVIAFLIYTLRIRMSLRKQLFEERSTHG
ncbi:polysaccharide deacetylase family protein [Paenibacillus sp. MZ04-78.2]|uniref:polysaccharide deacetylase family protein n=1 Tax=Paenibacillus sp. MZ04-78.2 TaxID=2962034 RepID=UPI0020B8A67E|nr:polysaccharide deacetylase family protein [Paenibacillus sp. MZ04-78.2]MCP3774181.1 polysaccharide deacetylase family protein [Paenibacillus sp. MZ04-78.2]